MKNVFFSKTRILIYLPLDQPCIVTISLHSLGDMVYMYHRFIKRHPHSRQVYSIF